MGRGLAPRLHAEVVLRSGPGRREGTHGEILTLVLGALVLSALTSTAPGLPEKAPSRVVDLAGILDDASERSLEARLASFESESSTQIVVATIPSLEGEEIADFSNRLFQRWELGQKGKNNGVLLLVATGDRKARIEVGYGLEDRLTDALSRRILEERLFPAFRQGNFAAGITDACDGIMQAVQGAYVAKKTSRKSGFPPAALIFVGFVAFVILIALQRGNSIGPRGRRRFFRSGPIIWGGGGGWGGGGFGGGGGGWGGGGGFSGGGGMSGGGGASGSW